MTDIHQSSQYASFIKDIGWQVEKIGKWQAFVKKFPFAGSLIKIQRIEPPVPFEEIDTLAKKHRAFKVVIEMNNVIARGPAPKQSRPPQISPIPLIPPNYKICHSPFLPTKTTQIDLTRSEKEIFDSITYEKQRAIRKAGKNGVIIKQGSAEEFIYLKRKSSLEKFIIPFGNKKDILALAKSFSPNQISFLIAHFVIARNGVTKQSLPLAGILLLFYEQTAYYWQAASLKAGRKLSAPSFLVWKALKLSKQKGCKVFDFEGIYDERFPNQSWLGFTRFKQGFGGKEVEFPTSISSSKSPLNFL